MNKDLRLKTIAIIAILAVFLWGIFLGTDPKASVNAMRTASSERGVGAGILAGIQQNIHLGLDLKGGIHLILQVMADEAVNADIQSAADRLKTSLKAKTVPFADVVPDSAQVGRLLIKGIPATQSFVISQIVCEQFPEYDFGSASDADLTLSMKSNTIRDIKQHAVEQSIETIRSRVDTLGVSEPIIEHHG